MNLVLHVIKRSRQGEPGAPTMLGLNFRGHVPKPEDSGYLDDGR